MFVLTFVSEARILLSKRLDLQNALHDKIKIMLEEVSLCYACGYEVSYSKEQGEQLCKCTLCDTLLRVTPGAKYAVPIGMELPEDFNKVDLDAVVKLTGRVESPPPASKAEEPEVEKMQARYAEISGRLAKVLQEMVTHTIKMELSGQSLPSDYSQAAMTEEDSKPEDISLKLSQRPFYPNRRIQTPAGEEHPAENGLKMLTPHERRELTQAHRDSGNEAPEITTYGAMGNKKSVTFFVLMMVSLVAFFMLIAYITMRASNGLPSKPRRTTSENQVVSGLAQSNSSEAGAAKTIEKSSERLQVDPQVALSRGGEFDIFEAKSAVIEFLNARDHEYAQQFIIPLENKQSLFSRYWRKIGAIQKNEVRAGARKVSPSGIKYVEFSYRDGNTVTPITVCQLGKSNYKVDWLSFAGVQEGSLAEFIKAGSPAIMTLRTKLTGSKKYTSFYNAKDWIAVTATAPDGQQADFYLSRRSTSEEMFIKGVEDPFSSLDEKKSGKFIYTVLAGSGSRPVIIDIQSTRWIE